MCALEQDRMALIEELRSLALSNKEPALALKIRLITASALFDLGLNTGVAMKSDHWKRYAVV